MDCTVHGILQARILEWVAFAFSRASSQPKDRISRIAGGFITSWVTREAQETQKTLGQKSLRNADLNFVKAVLNAELPRTFNMQSSMLLLRGGCTYFVFAIFFFKLGIESL